MQLSGFGNYHQSEAIHGALPTSQNSPQTCPFGLYAEQLSGSAFTRPRHLNLHSWLYRKLPAVVTKDYEPCPFLEPDFAKLQSPNPLRWAPRDMPTIAADFLRGLYPIAGNSLCQTWIYLCNKSMENHYFTNRDGELLFVPYVGAIKLATEMGDLIIKPGMIAVIPRGITFKVELLEKEARGYVCENSKSPFTLPQLGILGANALAHPRHFIYPSARFEEETDIEVTLFCKYQHLFWMTKNHHSPLNVVAWQGNYAPYSYDLSLFNTINSVSFDHPDPSIFTVLTSESNTPGVANLDFVLFPPRWMVAEHTFRPPYFHRNIMSELMGLIEGSYDAKNEGFSPGGISIHNCMAGHGPDADSYQLALQKKLEPEKYEHTLAFMLESRKPWLINADAFEHPSREKNYSSCWHALKNRFINP